MYQNSVKIQSVCFFTQKHFTLTNSPLLLSYFAIVVFKFLVLMIEEAGGDEAFLLRSKTKTLRISTGPCCCCCPCLPHVAITR